MADEDPWGTGEEEAPAASAPASAKATPKGTNPEGTPAKVATPAAATPAVAATPEKVQTPAKSLSKAPSPGFGRPEADVPSQDDIHIRRPLQLYKHWVRPQFLQYKYMYDYRINYYNDVIDYLDKRSRGVKADVPRAQYWAERVLRTHTNTNALDRYKAEKKAETHLIQTIASTIRTHNYHSTAYINRKYARVL